MILSSLPQVSTNFPSREMVGQETLPRNAAGKVLKRELRGPYWADQERAVH